LLSLLLQAIKQYWKISLLVVLFLPVLIWLGFWQLDRAEQKQRELTVYQQRQNLPVVPLAELEANTPAKYRVVSLRGRYDDKHYWLLDNQPRGGKAGYEIIMPFISQSGILLVNRGWLAASPRRSELPKIKTPLNEVVISGYLSASQENAIFDNTISDLTGEWPKRVLQVKVQDALDKVIKTKEGLRSLLSRTDENRSALLLRIDADSPGALLTEWPVINTKPEKHQGYAVQWFSMALALLALYVWFLYRMRREK